VNRIFGFFLLFAGIISNYSTSFAQSSVAPDAAPVFSCIGTLSAACPDGTISLRQYNNSSKPILHVSVAGYYGASGTAPQAALPGGGEFYRIGSIGGSPAVCVSTGFINGTGTVGTTTISGLGTGVTNGLTVGELVTGDGTGGADIHVAPGTEIASIPSSGTSVTLTLPLIGTTLGNQNMDGSFIGDNTGTLIVDAGGDCYQKTNYRGDPHEWGAYGDASRDGKTGHDDSGALQNWLGAYGNASNLAPATAPANFGPWVATMPANYLVSQPLFCPPNATIRGDENLTNNNVGDQANFNPRVNFIAAPGNTMTAPPFAGYTYTDGPTTSSFTGSQAVFGTWAYCRLSGIAVTGTGFVLATTGTTSGTTIQVAAVQDANGNQIQKGNAVAVTSPSVLPGDIAPGTVVTGVTGGPTCSPTCTVTISYPVSGSGTPNENITFYGPDAVDVLGNRLTIDNFSLLANGRFDLYCALVKADGMSIKDSSFQNAILDGVHIPNNCGNISLIGNIVADSGRDGLLFGDSEADIEGGVIEESGNAGLHLRGAQRVSITGMHLQGNGLNNLGGQYGAGVVFDGSNTITFCGNHLEGNGGDSADSSQVYFATGTTNVNLCGNAYDTQNAGVDFANKENTNDVTPSYVYDSDANAVLTNVHIYETAQQPAVSVLSPNALPLLASAVTPQFTNNQIRGLILSNDSSNSKAVDISPGTAADSTNSTLITLNSGCRVNLGGGGANGLDTGSGTDQANTTYYIYLIAAVRGNGTASAPTPSCMASQSLVPQFMTTFPGPVMAFESSGYLLKITGGTSSSTNVIYNVSSTSGVAVGDGVAATDGSISSGTTIAGFSANTQAPGIYGTWGPSSNSIAVSPTTGIYAGMSILDLSSGHNCIPSNTYITSVNLGTSTLTISNNTKSGMPCNVSSPTLLNISGAQQLTLNQNAALTGWTPDLYVSTAYYRLLGAVYTDSSKNVVQFTQDDDTFYLASSVEDITPSTCAVSGFAAQSCALSVPCGIASCLANQAIAVEAFGRIVGGAPGTPGKQMIITSFDQHDQPATPFATAAPGYSSQNSVADSSASFRAYTSTAPGAAPGSVRIRSNALSGSTTIYEVTDGWVFHR
jgi:hypothetical protein